GEEELIYNEVLAVLNFVQTHASVRDENGVVQTANIIWGNSVKPQLGDAIEVVLVATGFAGEQVDVNDAMTRILREPDIIPIETQPKKSEPQSVLEPLKPVQPATPAQNEAPVVLGTPPNRYGSRINKLLETPSYVTRNAQFIVQTTKSRKEVVHDESLEGTQTSDSVANGALDFGDDE
ncbi:MAG: cell division protein FtsZ, partial [Alistipes sp.]|nr:cell division protein FtsZ [Alistipes sp.]